MMQILSLSLLLPISYLTILITSMYTFSHLYRKRQSLRTQSLAPYFGPHTTRNVYLSLLHLPDTQSDAKVPDSVLRAALLSRACTDIERIMHVRTRKPALSQLLQRGVVGDEIWQRLVRAEQELELELKDVVAEANALANAWGQTIFQSAGEMVQNRMLREKLDGVKESVPEEKARWEQTRETTRRDFEKELGGSTERQQNEGVPTVEKARPVSSGTKTGSSDEDAVIVETPGLETGGNVGGGSGGKKKKRKGKN